MKYQVIVQPNAVIEAADAAIWWSKNRSAEQAARWYSRLEETLRELGNDADSHAFARENDRFPITLRKRSFGIGRSPTHRIVFHIKNDTVQVIAIRHLAQDDVEPGVP